MIGLGVLSWLLLWLAGAILTLNQVLHRHRKVEEDADAGTLKRRTFRAVRLPRHVFATAGTAGLLVLLVSSSPLLSLTALAGGAWLPFALRRRARERVVAQRREAWPDAIDSLASGVRAGLSLPEALADLGQRGPVPLQPAFGEFAADLRSEADFRLASDQLKLRLADPVADRVVESLRVARDVGGTDLGRLLRTLSTSIREESRLRAEVASRQSWTVNSARLAVVAPWLTLAVLALRPRTLIAYGSPTGAVVIAVAALTCAVAYRLMIRIGRLPVEERVLRR
jgi:tight adherence protein B